MNKKLSVLWVGAVIVSFFQMEAGYGKSEFTYERVSEGIPQVGHLSVYDADNSYYPLRGQCAVTLLNRNWLLTTATCANSQSYFSTQGLRLDQLVYQTSEVYAEQLGSGAQHKPGTALPEFRFLEKVYVPNCFFEKKGYSNENASVDFSTNPECDYALLKLLDPLPEETPTLTFGTYDSKEEYCSTAYVSLDDPDRGFFKSCGKGLTDPNELWLQPQVNGENNLRSQRMRTLPGFGGTSLFNKEGQAVGLISGGLLFGALHRPDPQTFALVFEGELLSQLNRVREGKLPSGLKVRNFGETLEGLHSTRLVYHSEESNFSHPVLIRRTAQSPSFITKRFEVSPVSTGTVFEKEYSFDFTEIPHLSGDEEELYFLRFEIVHSAYWWFGSKEDVDLKAELVPVHSTHSYQNDANNEQIVVRRTSR